MPEAELDAGTAQPFSHRGPNLRAWLELRWEALEQRVGRADPSLRPSFLLLLDGLQTWAQPLVSISAGLRFGTRGPSGLRKDKRLKAEAPSGVASAHLATAPGRGSRRKGLHFPEGSGILMTVLAGLREATAESRGENCGLSLSASPPDRSF